MIQRRQLDPDPVAASIASANSRSTLAGIVRSPDSRTPFRPAASTAARVVAAGAKNLGGLISRQSAGGGANVAIHYNSASTRIVGKIITIVTSLLAAFTDGYSTYAGGKAPVEHFTRAAAKEFAVRGISVNSVAPGPMDTPFFYGQETPQRGGIPQIPGDGQQSYEDRGHRPDRQVPGNRWLVDHGSDHLRQRRLHHPLNRQLSSERKTSQ